MTFGLFVIWILNVHSTISANSNWGKIPFVLFNLLFFSNIQQMPNRLFFHGFLLHLDILSI